MSTDQRFHALDASRGFALILGIVLHASMSFFLGFPTLDRSPSETLAVSFYVIHLFRMSLFFLIAGFFAHLLLKRLGARAFVKNRAKRIAVPMVIAWPILAPLCLAAIVWGFANTSAVQTTAPAPQPEGFPLLHLWFLYYLCGFYLLALALHALPIWDALTAALDRAFAFLTRTYLLPVLMALPCFLVFLGTPELPLWFGIATPDFGLIPKLSAVLCYGSPFLAGWFLHRQSALLELVATRWWLHSAIAIGLIVCCLSLIGITPDLLAPSKIAGGAATRLLYIAAYSLASAVSCLAILGVALRFFNRASGITRYLADASYWFYLMHLPIVFALQAAVAPLPWHWSLKFALIMSATMGVLGLSYHYLVRPSFIGELLNGRKYPLSRQSQLASKALPSNASVPKPINDPLPASTALAELEDARKAYGKQLALDGLSLSVHAGELLAILGPNGAGKSSAIGAWLGLLSLDQGRATIIGGAPHDVHSRLSVGVMLQEANLSANLRARELIALSACYYRDPLSTEQTIALAGIEAFADKFYGKLSAGQKRQVQFATAICGKPRLLFLDEPTVGLDIVARERMWRTIRQLAKQGCAMVLTTHYLEEAEALADRVAVVAAGKLIAQGTVEHIRTVVTRKQIRCHTRIAAEELRGWSEVVEVVQGQELVQLSTTQAETVLRRMFATDPQLSRLEVKQASLADAFTELTKDAA